MKKPRTKRYTVENGVLRYDLRDLPKPEPRPGGRPILESGTATKTVYLSKAPAYMEQDQLEKAVNRHEYLMRKELEAQGKLVTGSGKSIANNDGDIRISMRWVVLGTKPTKHARIRRNGADAAGSDVEEKPGRAPEPTSPETGAL